MVLQIDFNHLGAAKFFIDDNNLVASQAFVQIGNVLVGADAPWQKDPFSCRFPGGESYEDVMNRLESLIVDIEGYEGPILIVSHLS